MLAPKHGNTCSRKAAKPLPHIVAHNVLQVGMSGEQGETGLVEVVSLSVTAAAAEAGGVVQPHCTDPSDVMTCCWAG